MDIDKKYHMGPILDKVHRAGMILYYISETDQQINMLFQKPSNPKYSGPTYQLCKGKIEKGESALDGALREAQEEVGLFKPNIVGSPYNLGIFLGRTTVFVAEISDPTMFGESDDEVEATRWMTNSEFQVEGRPLHKPIIKAAHRWISEQNIDK